ncbi:hypothetical protein ADL26_19555, partial [Thermoactinomyces vulgaris]
QGVDPTKNQVLYGGGVEDQYLREFYELTGAPDAERPYRAIWSDDTPWQTRKFPGGGLQRQRNQRAGKGKVLVQRKPDQTGLTGDVWGLTPSAGVELLAEKNSKPVS